MADFLIGGRIDPATHERTGTDTTVASSDLTTHAVIVGMTGSGKTGLGIVLIEEALRAGVATLVIDPKGDLTNLCLTFPTLAASEFEPWINAGDAVKAGLSEHEFAAAQARTWTEGLAGWGLGTADIAALRDIECTIYTPGSSSGISVNIIGSLQVPADTSDSETTGDEIEAFVSGLLGLVGVDADPLRSRAHILLSNLIMNEWVAGRSPDLARLIGMVQDPPMRKLGVFELDSFFPLKDRAALAIRLNGLLASPSFGAWLAGPNLSIETMLRARDGSPRCAIVCTAHLSDEERQFATTLVLSKLVTWMRRQSGTTDLRAMLYMDEVAGYLPPTEAPPTKKPILTLMKQARAFGVGVVLSTQNPVDIDYKALSNAGTWIIGRLQTDRDKLRLLDGMRAAAGDVDVKAIGDTITGLSKREFVLRRAGTDQPETFTSRWAMSYLRGPLTREQIAVLMSVQKAAAPNAAERGADPSNDPAAEPGHEPANRSVGQSVNANETTVMPAAAEGIDVRWADVASPWLSLVGGDPTGTRRQAAAVARIALHYDDVKSGVLHDEEFEAIVVLLGEHTETTGAIGVDYDDRDLRSEPPVGGCTYELTDAPIANTSFWSRLERDLVDHLARSRSIEVLANRDLKLFGRPGETPKAFGARCSAVADTKADEETARLRDKYEGRMTRIESQLRSAQDRVGVLETEREGRRNEELLSTAGSILGGLFTGRRSRGGVLGSMLGRAGSAAGRRSRTSAAGDRLDAAEHKAGSLREQLQDLEAELVDDVAAIDARWTASATNVTAVAIPLERNDVTVTSIKLVWIPVAVARSVT
ncbi:MAG: DUF87 domain-containing protein [Ilumatobacteraceae bacterium]